MYICTYVRAYAYIYIHMCVYAYMYMCTYVYIYVIIYEYIVTACVFVYAYMYVCVLYCALQCVSITTSFLATCHLDSAYNRDMCVAALQHTATHYNTLQHTSV